MRLKISDFSLNTILKVMKFYFFIIIHPNGFNCTQYVSESRLKWSTHKVSFNVLTPSPLNFLIRKETLQAFNINDVYYVLDLTTKLYCNICKTYFEIAILLFSISGVVLRFNNETLLQHF